MESILISIKKFLGIEEDDTHFDFDVIMHINSVLMDLTQLGVGPSEGFAIEDEQTMWTDFVQQEIWNQIQGIKSYVYLRVKLLFDPPLNSSTIEVVNREIARIEWRINQVLEMQRIKREEELQNGE